MQEKAIDMLTDSKWLQSIGFIEDENSRFLRNGWLVITRDHGKWRSYSARSSHWHFLCDVNLRDDVLRLLAALKLGPINANVTQR